jgi:hypothetical protein
MLPGCDKYCKCDTQQQTCGLPSQSVCPAFPAPAVATLSELDVLDDTYILYTR